MKNPAKLLATLLLLFTAAGAPAQQTAAETRAAAAIDSFFTALGRRDFSRAHALTTGARWGTPRQFASAKMYGGIHSVDHQVEDTEPYGDSLVYVTCISKIADSVNGDGSYQQRFKVRRAKDNRWLVHGVELLAGTLTDSDGYNLKALEHFPLQEKEIAQLTAPVYDTAPQPVFENADDTVERTLETIQFFTTPNGGSYCLLVYTNQGPPYGISAGWCDVFVLFYDYSKGWKLHCWKLEAGGGGMYGYSGGFDRLVRMGKYAIGIVLEGGLTHMGESRSWSDVLAFEAGEITPLFRITDHYEYDPGDGLKKCVEHQWKLQKSPRYDNSWYDLSITRKDCKNAGHPLKKYLVVRYPGEGYEVPQEVSEP